MLNCELETRVEAREMIRENHGGLSIILRSNNSMNENAVKFNRGGPSSPKKIAVSFNWDHTFRETGIAWRSQLYGMYKSNNKKEAEKLIKNIIKVVIKLGVLHRNNMLSDEEMQLAEKFKGKFRIAGMAIISFFEVDFSYDANYIVRALRESQKCLESIVSKHLTDKSVSRIDSVFSFFADEHFLDAVFKRESEYREALGRVVADLNKAIDNGDL
ncbi:unnamed protein product [Phaedon cochleariae]|uniref:Tumor necrosis factor alpha-induced protein 8-like protein n=1 Tax=Phaedon cochleariae TaxID=80249 RepID=A0A9N9SJS4_PHACE|nr:unnamed protein product [Phaedon cochleariae]